MSEIIEEYEKDKIKKLAAALIGDKCKACGRFLNLDDLLDGKVHYIAMIDKVGIHVICDKCK